MKKKSKQDNSAGKEQIRELFQTQTPRNSNVRTGKILDHDDMDGYVKYVLSSCNIFQLS